MNADVRMADWTGPIDETYFTERQRRMMNGGSEPPPLFDRQPREDDVHDDDEAGEPTPIRARHGSDVGDRPARGTSVITPLADFLDEVDDATLDVVAGIIPADALILWVGQKESFKSMAAATLHGAVATAGEWMGQPVLPMRSVYVSNEKRRRSVRERFRAIVGARHVTHDVGIVHRQGLTIDIGNPKWCRFVDEIEAMGERVLITLDTLTSLAPQPFKENTPEAMAVVLAAVRMLTSLPIPASVNLLHHPAWADTGGKETRGRGHSSLEGEHDGLLSFHRPDRAKDEGVIHARPKDGDYRLMPFVWDRGSMLILPRDLTGLPLTAETALEIVDGLGGTATVADVRLALGHDLVSDRPRFSEDRVMTVLNQCEAAGDLTSSRPSSQSKKVFSTRKKDER